MKKSLILTLIFFNSTIHPFSFDFETLEKKEPLFEHSLAKVSARVIELIVTKVGMDGFTKSLGLYGRSANEVHSTLGMALKSLTGFDSPTPQQLGTALSRIQDASSVQVLNDVRSLLSKETKDLTPNEYVDLVNGLVFLAGRNGFNSGLALSCSACVGSKLSDVGFSFTLERLTDSRISYIASNIVPNDAREMSSQIKGLLRKNELSANSSRYFRFVRPEDEKALAVFLNIPTYGTPAHKALYDEIIKLSKDGSGKVELFDEANGHTLWRVFTMNLSEAEIERWNGLLSAVNKDSLENPSLKKSDLFYRQLEQRAGGDPVLARKVESIKTKKCFFK